MKSNISGSGNAISHTLRTPITCILGFTHLLFSENLTKQQREYIQHIETSAYKILSAIERISRRDKCTQENQKH